MDIIYTKIVGEFGQGLNIYTKKLFSLLTFTQALLPYKSLWPNGYSAGLSRGRSGFNSRHLLIFYSIFVTLVSKKIDFKTFLNPFSLNVQRL